MSKRKTVTLIKIQHVRKDILSIKKESKLSLTAVNHHELHCGPAQPHLPRALKFKGALLRGWPPVLADMAQKANAGPPDSSLGSLNLGGQKSEAGGDGGPYGSGPQRLAVSHTYGGTETRREFWVAHTLKTYTSDSRNVS